MKLSEVLTTIALALCVLVCVRGHSSGAPKNHKVCKAMRPHHGGARPQTDPSPYIVTTSKDKVPVNTAVEITLTSHDNATDFKGFLLQVRGSPVLSVKPIGVFEIVDPDRSKPLNCYDTTDTVTHSNPQEKKSITFKWIPPQDLKGAVYCQASFVQVFPIYWIHVQTKVVIGSGGKVDSKWLQPYPPEETDLLHKYLNFYRYSKFLHQFYEGCGSTKKCFGMPENCISTRSCDAIMSVVKRDFNFEFEMVGKDSDYVALRLSESNDLSKNSVTECLLVNNVVELYHSPKYSTAQVQYPQNDTYRNVVLMNSSYQEGTIYCKFSRNQTTDVDGSQYDLKQSKYFVTLAIGNIKKGLTNKIISFDNIKFKASENRMNLSDANENIKTVKKSNLATEESFSFGSWVLNTYKFLVRLI